MQFSIKNDPANQAALRSQARPRLLSRRGEAAFVMSLWEVTFAFVIVAIMFGVILNGYTQAAKRSQWTGYSLAAQALGLQAIEQLRSAVWDPAMPGKMVEATNMNLLSKTFLPSAANWTNVTGYTTNIMDIPWKGTNYSMATNWVTIRLIKLSYNTNISVQMVRVDTVWPFNGWGQFNLKYYTNTVCTFIAPDNRDPSTLGN
jgi:hypothetical protein